MSTYGRDEILPEWEPVPWGMDPAQADEQERGFHVRATRTIRWQPIPWAVFPAEGIFGHDKSWFATTGAEFTASADGEDLLLIHNIWSGWPDPPEWGLISRPARNSDASWVHWGHFAFLPDAWDVPLEGGAV